MRPAATRAFGAVAMDQLTRSGSPSVCGSTERAAARTCAGAIGRSSVQTSVTCSPKYCLNATVRPVGVIVNSVKALPKISRRRREPPLRAGREVEQDEISTSIERSRSDGRLTATDGAPGL